MLPGGQQLLGCRVGIPGLFGNPLFDFAGCDGQGFDLEEFGHFGVVDLLRHPCFVDPVAELLRTVCRHGTRPRRPGVGQPHRVAGLFALDRVQGPDAEVEVVPELVFGVLKRFAVVVDERRDPAHAQHREVAAECVFEAGLHGQDVVVAAQVLALVVLGPGVRDELVEQAFEVDRPDLLIPSGFPGESVVFERQELGQGYPFEFGGVASDLVPPCLVLMPRLPHFGHGWTRNLGQGMSQLVEAQARKTLLPSLGFASRRLTLPEIHLEEGVFANRPFGASHVRRAGGPFGAPGSTTLLLGLTGFYGFPFAVRELEVST